MAMKNLFNSIKVRTPDRNFFDLTHTVLTTFQMGKLVPTMCMEALPGDSFTLGSDMLTRLAPMVNPTMHDFDIYSHYYFSPNRVVWPGWEDFITGKATRVYPTVTYTDADYLNNPLFGYLDLPRPGAGILGQPDYDAGVPVTVSALPFAHYQFIYNEWYRAQALISDVNYELVDGDNSANADLFVYRTRGWEHDRYNSALPEAQAGQPVLLPIGSLTDAPIKRNTNPAVNTLTEWQATELPSGTAGTVQVDHKISESANVPADDLYADISDSVVEATTVNDLRTATKIQEWLELAARAGERYIENILAFFGVRSSDARLQRPEYITGNKTRLIITEVLNTSGFVGTGPNQLGRPMGDMAGHGITNTVGTYGSQFCEEHGYIMCIVSCMPKPAYNGQGVPKHYLRRDRYQYYWPQFAHLGEEGIEVQELFVRAANRSAVFGYTPRYSEMRFEPNRVSGQFRSTMMDWHEAINFNTTPALNSIFVECDPDNRIFAVPGTEADPIDHVWVQMRHNIGAKRPIPVYGTPSFV